MSGVQVSREVPELVRLFADVALADPLSFVLVVAGALLVGFSTLLAGYLTVGGLVAWALPGPSTGRPGRPR